MVKFTESQFQVSPSTSSVFTGGVVVPAAIIGAILGGIIIRKYDLQVEGCVRLIMLASIIVLAGVLSLLFVTCAGPPSMGIDLTTSS